MITTSREADFTAKSEGNTADIRNDFRASSSSTSWSRLKDPRIVRVSRAFGGKDRHSKVCTVRGLRDRRVRLSVPTAIQLYDLQDKLGLNQPSKVVDWLLNAAKHEIDELPPLQIPPGTFSQNHQLFLATNQERHDHGTNSQSNKEALKIDKNIDWSNFWNSDAGLRDKSKEVTEETKARGRENWKARNDDREDKQGDDHIHSANIDPTCNLFPRSNHGSIPGLLNNVAPYNPFYRLDPSNFSLSHIGSHGFSPHTEDSFDYVPLPSTLSLQSRSQVLVCPPGTAQPYFPPHAANSLDHQFDPKQIKHFQTFGSNSQNPFHLSICSDPVNSQNGSESQSNNNNEFPPK